MEKTEFHVQRLLNETFGSSIVQQLMVGQGFPLSDTSFLILPKFNSWLTFFMLNACSGMRFQDSSKDKIRCSYIVCMFSGCLFYSVNC